MAKYFMADHKSKYMPPARRTRTAFRVRFAYGFAAVVVLLGVAAYCAWALYEMML